MRTNIDIDDGLLKEAMRVTGETTKKAIVEAGLRTLVSQHERRKALLELRGIGWEGDLEQMRNDWPSKGKA